jgi:hypothetical protein
MLAVSVVRILRVSIGENYALIYSGPQNYNILIFAGREGARSRIKAFTTEHMNSALKFISPFFTLFKSHTTFFSRLESKASARTIDILLLSGFRISLSKKETRH